MFKPVPVEITNSYDFPIKDHPFSIGVPFEKGAVFSTENLRLIYRGQLKQFHVTLLANWPDGSVKWLLLDFQHSLEADEQATLLLELDEATGNHLNQQSESVNIVTHDAGDEYFIDTGPAQFKISKSRLGLFDQVTYKTNELLTDMSSSVQLIDEQGEPAASTVTSINLADSENRLRKIIIIDGYFQSIGKKAVVDFSLKLTFYSGLATVKCEFTLLNQQAAKHPGGVWDLGDDGSFFFNELSVNIQLANTVATCQASIKVTPEAEWYLTKNGSLTLEQNSSGGKNWQSKNHMNFKGEVPLEYKGYRFSEKDVEVASGDRATPFINVASGGIGVTAHIVDFWQNFPKGLQVNQSNLRLSLFPQKVSDHYELQGGERKKHTFYLDFSNEKASLDCYVNEIIPRIPLGYYAQTKIVPWLPSTLEDTVIQRLINRGIQGENNFFEKREVVDEFGWRNFGEVFADHEQLEYKGSDELISHYNNQYDPLYGFIKQYLISGDGRWYELLSELAQHIVDIDIYHTVNDRDEYNGGLFWHTHHYLTAFTCTHRTFSCKHADDFIYGEIGGGPGAQHCYTTGLSYYYFMTGDTVYKDAALQLVNWVSRVLEGSGAVVERLFQFKSKDLPVLKRLISGETVQRYKYPFTRGTGNYITALIDGYNLTGERHYLLSVERVIKQSIHPRDDISLRNLKDIEASWSYLIYLQAVCKYLELKTSLQEFDEACFYAKDSLLHYVDWMADNESPFLNDPEKLEYPNHTWAAQDLRKANLFYMASLYSDNNKAKYLEVARFYVRYVEDIMSNEETRYFSRILILLMQNDVLESGLDYEATRPLRDLSNETYYSSAPLYSIPGVLVGALREVGGRTLKLSFKNEQRWLSVRLK